MKNQNFPRSTKPKVQDPIPGNDGHRVAASVRNSRPACEPVHKKPLAGRIFYLDLPCNKRSQALEYNIKSLGGTVEKFFSKEIRYLVSSKPEARHVQRLIQDSPVPSPDSGHSSPHPGSRRDSHGHRGSSQGPADTVVVSRGKSLVEKVVKEQERIQMNRILSNALEWGVKILYIDDILSYIDKKRSAIARVRTETVKPESTDFSASQKSKPGRISRPFVKVEDSSRHYRPLYLPMAKLPVCNLRSAAPCSPFLEENAKEIPGKRPKVCGSGGDLRERSRKDRHRGCEFKGRRKGGYCECCLVKYDNINAHLQSEQHQSFSKSEEYLVVDRIISGLTCDLVPISPEMKRVKCSVTSPLIVPGAAAMKDDEMRVEAKDVTDKTPLRGCRDNRRSVRKRSRELCPRDSKRGSFDWESSSNSASQITLGTLLCNTRQDNHSECLERTRPSLHTHSGRRTSQSTQHVRLSEPAGFGAPQSSLEAGASDTGSEPSVMSNFQTAPKLHCDVAECTKERRFCNSGQAPNVPHHESVTEELSSSSTDTPSGVLQRKVRTMKRRRTAPTESPCGPAGKPVEPQTPQWPGNVSESHRLSASPLDLWQLFQPSDDTEEDFKGFYDLLEKKRP